MSQQTFFKPGLTRKLILLSHILSCFFLITLLSGCAHKKKKPPTTFRYYIESSANLPREWARPITLPRSETRFHVFPHPVLSEHDFQSIQLAKVDLGYCLLFQCNDKGRRRLTEVTSSHLGKSLILTVNEVPIGFRCLDTPITNGQLFLFVELTDPEIQEAATNWNAELLKQKKL